MRINVNRSDLRIFVGWAAKVWSMGRTFGYDRGVTHDGPAVAILDIDGTMHPRSIGIALLHAMGQRGVGRRDAMAGVTAAVGEMQAGVIEFPEMVARATAAYAAALTGIPQQELVALAEETWRDIRGELFPFVRPLIARLAAAGVSPYIVSSSPHEIVALLAADLGVPDCQGSRFTVVGGQYTGICDTMPGARGGKLTLLRAFAASRGASLSRSLALGNGPGDLEVLAAVGHPLVFEAGEPLLTIARQRGWQQVNRNSVLDYVDRALAS